MIALAQTFADQANGPLTLYVLIVLSAGHLTKHVMVPLIRAGRP